MLPPGDPRRNEGSIMSVLIIGASKGIGLETTRQALDAGFSVRALARSAAGIPLTHPNLEKFPGNALSLPDVEVALEGAEAVIQTLGVAVGDLFRPITLFSESTRVLIAAMTAKGVKRLITVTGFGAGDSRPYIHPLQRIPFRLILGRAYDDKTIQETLIKQSALDWTIARPGVLNAGPHTGRYLVLENPDDWRNGNISRADVADFLVRQIDDNTYVGKAPVLVNPK